MNLRGLTESATVLSFQSIYSLSWYYGCECMCKLAKLNHICATVGTAVPGVTHSYKKHSHLGHHL